MTGLDIEVEGSRRREPLGSSDTATRGGGRAAGRLLLLASMATSAVAAWLLMVSVQLLPARDPGHVMMWRWTAVALLGYAGLSLGFLRARRPSNVLTGLLVGVSVLAAGAGIFAIAASVRVADRGGHFEGYLVLMGWLVGCHGLTAIMAALARGNRPRRVAGSEG